MSTYVSSAGSLSELFVELEPLPLSRSNLPVELSPPPTATATVTEDILNHVHLVWSDKGHHCHLSPKIGRASCR